MTRVWDETRFRGTDLLILLCLADHANDQGACWPSYQTLAKRARCSRRQAIRCVQKLSAEGWIYIEHRRVGPLENKSNVFHLRIPEGGGDAKSLVTNGEGGGDICDIFSDENVTRVVSPMSPKPSGNHKGTIKENLVSSQGRTSEDSPSEFPDIEELEAFVCESTGLDFTHANACAEKWLAGVQGKRIHDWRAHLGAFADKYENDYRQ